jgi:hypothetical protein
VRARAIREQSFAEGADHDQIAAAVSARLAEEPTIAPEGDFVERRRMKVRALVMLTIVLTVGARGTSVAGASVDPGTRTVAAGSLQAQWSQTIPEEIRSLSWNDSPNLTNTWEHPFCTGDSEFFGNSWGTDGGVNFVSPVGWGTKGTWSVQGAEGVRIDSAASGCYGTSGIPVETSYRFFDHGAVVDRMLVRRKFSFGATPFASDLRPYIPRLYPRDQYSVVIHPNAAGTALATEIGNDCEFGCAVTNWDGTWFAIHDPGSGRGMIARHAFSSEKIALWVDMDGGSWSAASSVVLLQPRGGFTGTVSEVESFCFYDSRSWTPALTVPDGC